MNWYYVENGQRVGPVNDGNLNRLLKDGTVKPDTLVWRDGLDKFVPYRQMTIGAAAVAAANATVCSECGRSFQPDELTTLDNNLVCAACRPLVVRRLNEETAPAGTMIYGGFWIRAAARVIDVMVIYSLNFVLAPLVIFAFSKEARAVEIYPGLSVVFLSVSLCVQMVYFTCFVGGFGATPGKMVCGLKIVRPDGGPVSYGRAFGRFFGETLSGFTFCIGYLMVAFDGEKRALHDRICGTRVIKVAR